jgi:hypothetical protein
MAKIKSPEDILKEINPKALVREYKLTYDSTSQTLEPIYFWILDFMNGAFGGNVEKILDNFSSSPGSGHFSEIGQKATRMQEEAMKIYGMVNTVIKSILNLIYDLKEFQLRLKNYEDSDSSDSHKAMAGTLSLKQIWMDQVDIKRGRGSINMLSQDMNFVTLRDAFMAVKDETLKSDTGKVIDLNERVQRILKPRIAEFLEWKSRSYTELVKRFEIEKTYLKTQVNTVKTYSRWVKPYLVAAENLGNTDYGKYKPELVHIFNTLFLELALMGKKKIKVAESAVDGDLPPDFKKIKIKRDYYQCVLIDFKFRGIPQKAGQHYVFGGRADVTFRAYGLNQDELDLFKYKLEKSDFEDSLKLISGMTDETLGQLQQDINEFLEDKSSKQNKEKQAQKETDANPFTALLGIGKLKSKSEKKSQSLLGKTDEDLAKEKENKRLAALEKSRKKDNYAEEKIRKFAAAKAKGSAYSIYDIYKKGHGMASTPDDA